MPLISGITKLRERFRNRWLIPYLLQTGRRHRCRRGPTHALICVADHYEPRAKNASDDVARARVESWVSDYPSKFGGFRDSDGRTPRHTFFYPIEEYEPDLVEALAELCRAGYGEIEFHLHHDNDNAESLRKMLVEARDCFRSRHGLLGVDRKSGQPAFGFIHGNWALDNCQPDGRWCGVNNELDVLREAGCYADFTFPSAPSPTQPPKINSIYYAIDDPERPGSHNSGMDVGTGRAPANGLMLIQGPLVLDWSRRRWGLVPGVENGCIQTDGPPHIHRLALWLKAKVQIPGRPDWFFVKLYSHGAPERQQQVLLGEPMVRFHQHLADRARHDPNFHYHYVTAREMYNLVKAAEDGWSGTVAEAVDYRLVWNGAGSGTRPSTHVNTGDNSVVHYGSSA